MTQSTLTLTSLPQLESDCDNDSSSEENVSNCIDGKGFLPHPDMVCDFQGGWTAIRLRQEQPVASRLRTFVVTGRAWFGGDGSDACLQMRDYDREILLEG